jgi:hypothetical protein
VRDSNPTATHRYHQHLWHFNPPDISISARDLYTLRKLADETGTRHTLETESVEQLLSDELIYVVDPARHSYRLTPTGKQVLHTAQAEGAV